MLIDRYFDDFFGRYRVQDALRASGLAEWRVPSRLVRYGIIHTDTLKNALESYEPRFDAAMKAQAEKMVEKLQAFIECCEAYEEATVDGPTADDDANAEAK